LLDEIHEGRILCANSVPTDGEIEQALSNHPNAMVITLSRKASNRINQLPIEFFFKDRQPLIHVQCDCDLPPLPIYEHLPVIITQNRDKKTVSSTAKELL
jgi:hypothetical protein